MLPMRAPAGQGGAVSWASTMGAGRSDEAGRVYSDQTRRDPPTPSEMGEARCHETPRGRRGLEANAALMTRIDGERRMAWGATGVRR